MSGRFAKQVEQIHRNVRNGHSISPRDLAEVESFLSTQDWLYRYNGGETLREIAKDYGISFQYIWRKLDEQDDAIGGDKVPEMRRHPYNDGIEEKGTPGLSPWQRRFYDSRGEKEGSD